jgi:hypothetical protein
MPFFRAIAWGSLTAIALGLLAALFLFVAPSSNLGTILLFLVLPAGVGLSTAIFLHGIPAIMISMVLANVVIGLTVLLAAGPPAVPAVLGFAQWILGGIVFGVLIGMALRHHGLSKNPPAP